MSEGYYKTKKKAVNKASQLRRDFPRMKPVRVVKRDVGWDVIATHQASLNK